jgi:glyoxylase-like metal-dependent hydrolase (beta-lactamase superfamily II)
VEPLLDETAKRGWNLVGLWLTHGHFDHFADHALVRKRFPSARILIHVLDEPKASNPEVQTRMFQLPFVIPPLKADGNVSDNESLRLGSLEVKVLHTPGHSPGHVCYHFPGQQILVGGDLIIGGSVGRTDLPDSRPADLETSIRRVMQLPDATKLLGGHGPVTTLGEERQRNSYVRSIVEAE